MHQYSQLYYKNSLIGLNTSLHTIASRKEFLYYHYYYLFFTGGFQNWDLTFSIVAFVACLIGRAINIFPLTFIANLCRDKSNKIPAKMSVVLWFAGLRGAIAFALSENMVCTISIKNR
jgi:sodium/hydrogen exchanger 8